MNQDDDGIMMHGAVVSAKFAQYEGILIQGATKLMDIIEEHPKEGVNSLENSILSFVQAAEHGIEDSSPPGEKQERIDSAMTQFLKALGAETCDENLEDGAVFILRVKRAKPVKVVRAANGAWVVQT